MLLYTSVVAWGGLSACESESAASWSSGDGARPLTAETRGVNVCEANILAEAHDEVGKRQIPHGESTKLNMASWSSG